MATYAFVSKRFLLQCCHIKKDAFHYLLEKLSVKRNIWRLDRHTSASGRQKTYGYTNVNKRSFMYVVTAHARNEDAWQNTIQYVRLAYCNLLALVFYALID